MNEIFEQQDKAPKQIRKTIKKEWTSALENTERTYELALSREEEMKDAH